MIEGQIAVEEHGVDGTQVGKNSNLNEAIDMGKPKWALNILQLL